MANALIWAVLTETEQTRITTDYNSAIKALNKALQEERKKKQADLKNLEKELSEDSRMLAYFLWTKDKVDKSPTPREFVPGAACPAGA